MESTASSTVVLHAMRWTAVAKQQENALEYANPDGKEFSVSGVRLVHFSLIIEEIHHKEAIYNHSSTVDFILNQTNPNMFCSATVKANAANSSLIKLGT